MFCLDFNEFKKWMFFDALKSSKNIKLQNIVRFFQDFILTCEIWRLKALISNFATQIFWVPILSLNSSNSSEFLNKKYINKAYKCDFTAKRGTPNGTQKSYSKIVNSELSSDVSVMCIGILDQKLHTCQYSWFFDIPLNLQKHHFFVWN